MWVSHVVAELNDNHGANDASPMVTLIDIMDSCFMSMLSLNVNGGSLIAP